MVIWGVLFLFFFKFLISLKLFQRERNCAGRAREIEGCELGPGSLFKIQETPPFPKSSEVLIILDSSLIPKGLVADKQKPVLPCLLTFCSKQQPSPAYPRPSSAKQEDARDLHEVNVAPLDDLGAYVMPGTQAHASNQS